MSKVGKWSTTAGNNNAAVPDGWPENQLPSTVNNCAREMMAALATYIRASEYVDLDNTPSFLTTTTFSLGTSDSTNFEVGRRVKLFDTTTLYGTIISNSATFVQVRLDSGVLSTSLSSVAVSTIRNTNNSLPTNSFRNNNFIINGQMDIWQRGSTFNGTTNLQYLCDRFQYQRNLSAGSVNFTRLERSAGASNVPTLAQTGFILNSSLNVSVSAVEATLSATHYGIIAYNMEGYDWRQIAHKPFSVSFWVKTNRSGIYSCAVRGATLGQSYVNACTISTINTWQRFFLPIPEAPTTGTWDYSIGVGLTVFFTLGAGTSYQATANEWTAMNAVAVSTQTNFFASAGNVLTLANFELHEGMADIPMRSRPYAEELALCQRYYWRGLPALALNFPAFSIGCVNTWLVNFPVTMRTIPALSSTMATAVFAGGAVSLTALPSVATNNGFRITMFNDSVGLNCNVTFTTGTDFFEANAEL